MATVTYFMPSAIIGNGTKANPRRITVFGRLDFILTMIDDGIVCFQPDGSIDMGITDSYNMQQTIVADLGPVAITRMTMDEDFWNLSIAYAKNVQRYDTVYGTNKAELQARALTARNQIVTYLVNNANITPEPGPNLAVRAYRTLKALNVTGPTAVVRDYYTDRMDGSGYELPPALRAAGEGLNPTWLRNAIDAIKSAPATSPVSWMHHAYDMALLDVIVRA